MIAAAVIAAPLVASGQSLPVLIEAVKGRDPGAVRALIAGGADANATQGDGATALHWAAHHDDLDAANLLLDAGATASVANELGATPLWLAAVNGSAPMIARLLEGGADPNAALAMGETPLMTAARSGRVDAVELLLEAGADVNTAEHEGGQTALMWAVAQGHADVAQALIAGGANVDARTNVWHQLENTAGNTNPSGNYEMAHGGSTPLLFAARQGDVETGRVLVAAGADVNDTSAAGTSVLVIAAHSGHTPLGVYLLEQGADPNAAGAGYTALHGAVLRGEAPMVEALLDHGAEVDAAVEHGTPGRRFSADFSIRHQLVGANALWMAAQYGEPEILHTLVEHGANPHWVSGGGSTALHAAMGVPGNSAEDRRNRTEIPFLDPEDEARQNIEMARILLELGVDVNAVDGRGNTPLHMAVRRGFPSVVEFLAANGANLDAVNGNDQTAVALAESRLPIIGSNGLRTTHPEIAELLRRLGAEG